MTGSAPFGGYSDILLDAEGGSALAISDTGHVLPLALTFDAEGDVTAATASRWHPMIDAQGRTLDKQTGDAEGLAPVADGYVVTFEGEDRLVPMTAKGRLGAAQAPAEEDEDVLGANSGFEGLARLRDGSLIAISEGKRDGLAIVRSGRQDEAFSAWRRSAYRPAEDFAVTAVRQDAASGDLFVLERAWSPWRGARARLVRVPEDRIGDAVVEGEALGRLGFLEGIDNMEGMDLAPAPDGSLRLYLLSDDNVSPVQRTVLMTVGLAAGCGSGAAEAAAGTDAPAQEPVED
nr:esterase-like activity of phytase family protein [Parvularcula dongshanensis]